MASHPLPNHPSNKPTRLPHDHAAGRLTLSIAGMSCGHCVAAVRSALQEVPGVSVEQVVIGSASVTLAPNASADALVESLRDAGYDATVAPSTQ